MKFSSVVPVLAGAAPVLGQIETKPDADGRYTISAQGIKAQFIPYGATLTNLFVKDKNGKDIDVVLGYDNTTYYPVDPGHPVYNAIPGRYVNRIGNAKYTLDGKKYQTEANDGANTLHSGTNNWSFRFWNVTAATDDSITFAISDPAFAEKGLPGKVDASVTYSVSNGTWHIKMDARSPETRTPLMLTQHTYFNLDAYKNPDTAKIWNHTLYMPRAKRFLEADDGALPTGAAPAAAPKSINDFWSAPGIQLGHASGNPEFPANCGGGGNCEGYNGYFVFDDAPDKGRGGEADLTLASEFSGVRAELRTDQPGVVIYTCNWMDGSADLKSTQGLKGQSKVVRSSCVAIEAQDWVDGINHPEWKRLDAQIFGPGNKYSWESSWSFGLL